MKLVLGVLLAGVGVVLLAGHLGYLPPGMGDFLAHYWPVLLIAVGLGLLANSMKSALLGWVATLIVIGGLAYGAWWVHHHGTAPKPTATSTLNLNRPHAETLTVRARVFGG